MNKFIKEQLEKVEGVSLPPWDDSTTYMEIKKAASVDGMVVGGCYKIQLSKLPDNVTDNLLVVFISSIVGEKITADARNLAGTHNYYGITFSAKCATIIETY